MRTIGRYLLGPEIAMGGMATVHVGRLVADAGVGRTVAIKRLHPQYAKDPAFHEMFLDEARLASRIHHPNVAGVVDLIVSEGELTMVLEYVHGATLGALCREQAPVPPSVATSIVLDVLHGLGHAHELATETGAPLSIVHRDVSPQNVIVGVDGVARLLDFGIAKAAVRMQTTREGQVKGKLAYMAPEQLLSGNAVDRRADLYSAGVVLWELLTGRPLFQGDNEQQILFKILSGVIDPPSFVAPNLDPAWDALIERALAISCDMRFATALDFATALEATVQPASRKEVGAWVAARAGTSLDRLAGLVRDLETSAKQPIAPVTEEATPLPVTSAERRARKIPRTLLIALAGGVVVAGSAAAIVYAWPRHEAPPSAPAQASSPVTSSPVTASVEASPVPAPSSLPEASAPVASTPAPSSTSTDEAPSVLPASKAAGAPPSARSAPRALPAATAHAPSTGATARALPTGAAKKPGLPPGCENPIWIDAQGIQRVKRECVR